jgi:AbrB family looped-hinge helix DNA binding protein
MDRHSKHGILEGEPEIALVSSKGQIVIPVDIREKLGIKAGSVFAVSAVNGDMVVMKKLESRMSAEERETLDSVRRAWEQIERGEGSTYTVEEFREKLLKNRL